MDQQANNTEGVKEERVLWREEREKKNMPTRKMGFLRKTYAREVKRGTGRKRRDQGRGQEETIIRRGGGKTPQISEVLATRAGEGGGN